MTFYQIQDTSRLLGSSYYKLILRYCKYNLRKSIQSRTKPQNFNELEINFFLSSIKVLEKMVGISGTIMVTYETIVSK